MKTLKLSDEAHAELTSAILNKSVLLSPDLLDKVESFITKNAQLGYSNKEEFIQDAIRSRLTCLSGDIEAPEFRKPK